MKKGKEWFINELLDHEIGDYGNSYNSGYDDGLAYALQLARQLDEPTKVVVPQFVATFIEDSRNKVGNIVTAIWEMYEYEYKRVYEWALEDGNDEVLMKAFANGYEIEKEKLYVVELSNDHLTNYLAYDLVYKVFFISQSQEEVLNKYKKKFTEKEIKDYDDRFWPFAVEVEE